MEWFLMLLVAGLILIGAELFVPGAVMGILGACALAAALIVAFVTQGPVFGGYAALGIIVLLGISLFVWVRVFPKTRVGQSLTLAADGRAFKSADAGLRSLVGKRGEALSQLRPAGNACLEGRTYDVVTEGGMIEKGRPVQVVKVEGNRVVVRECEA